jgi:hypothetical protein
MFLSGGVGRRYSTVKKSGKAGGLPLFLAARPMAGV